MQEYSAVARFYNGTSFGAFHFKTFRGLPGVFVDSDTGYPMSLKSFPLEPGQDFADIKINELIDLFYTPKIVESEKAVEPPAEVEKPTKKPRFVEFVRYARPLKDGEIDSSRGVTFAFRLDYLEKTISFGYAVCNGDNFSKKIGTDAALADLDNTRKVILMEDGKISEEGAMYDVYSKHKNLLDHECRRQLKNFYKQFYYS